MKKHKLFALAVLIAALLCSCTAAIEESAPPAIEPSVTLSIEPSPSVEPTPEPTPRVLLDYSDCAEYVRYDPPESDACQIKLTGTNPDDWEDFTLDCDVGESSEGEGYSLRRGWFNNMEHVLDAKLAAYSDDGKYISEIIANADFIEDDSLTETVYVGIEMVDLESGIEYAFLPEGKVIRYSEPYAAAQVGIEAYARLSVITWKNWTTFSSWGSPDNWLYDYASDENAEYYTMCVQTEQKHVHLTIEEAREFVKTLCPIYARDGVFNSPKSYQLSKLGWDAYDGYVRIDEYFGNPTYTDENGDTVVETKRHFAFSDNSLSANFGTRFVYYSLAYPKVREQVFEVINSTVPRATHLAPDFADYDAALAWIASRSDE